MLVTGGEDINESQTGNTEFFHPATGTWLKGCPTRVAHDEAQLLPFGTGLLEIGGEQNHLDFKKFHIMNRSSEIYVPATGKFKLGPALTMTLEDFAAVSLSGGSIMVIGGVTGTDTETPVQNAEILKSGFWKKLAAKMTVPRAAPCAAVMTGGSKSGQVLIAGGTDTSEDRPQLDTAELYNPATGTFTATAHNMIAARSYALATALPDGTVLITGGIDNSFNAINIAEIYDPETDTFTETTGTMNANRVDHSATLLPNGKVLIAGGETSYLNSTTKLSSAELYDPSTGMFTPTPDMNDHRDDNTATLISGSGTALDGKVLIEGGFFNSHAENTAEIYDPVANTFTPTTTMNYAHGEANAAIIK